MKPKLILIDGTAIIYRTYYAFIKNPLINSKGQNTSAIFGTVNTFLKLLDTFDTNNIVISFDLREKTFRHKLDENYKANRPEMPEDLVGQIQPIRDFFDTVGLTTCTKVGFEADDVLATIAERCRDDYEIVLVTGDKDYAQLIDDNIEMFDPFKNETLRRKEIEEKYGVKPEQFVDYLALVGDTADNIPGVKGIGKKGAAKLLEDFGTLENIYEHVEDVTPQGTRDKLIENRENAFLSQTLARMVRDVEIEIDRQKFPFKRGDIDLAIPFFQEYELKSILKKVAGQQEIDLFGEEPTPAQESGVQFESILIDTRQKFEKLLQDIPSDDFVAIDTETTSTDPMMARLVGISLCWQPEKAYYLPVAHSMSDNLGYDETLAGLKKALAGCKLVGHNIKYDMHVLKRAGWTIGNIHFDTMVAAYVLDPGEMRNSLDSCSQRELGYTMIPISDLIGKGKNQETFDMTDTRDACRYAAEDADITLRLFYIYRKRLSDMGLEKLFFDIEMPLIQVLADMEENGVYIDTSILDDISKRTQQRIAELQKEIFETAGKPFNINSTKQLAEVLFQDMGIKPVKKTKTGLSTDNSVLEELARENEIARTLIEYRKLTKLESTYTTALPKMINPLTGRIHSSFNQTIASTGRLSSSNPNLQNIPSRTDLGREIRKAFVPEKNDCVILAGDYSQIELRLAAIMSGDDNLINAFRNREDIHRQTAAIIFEKDPGDVTSDDRKHAKVINFGILYGMGPNRLSGELNISRGDAQDFIDNYFAKFPTMKAFIDEQIKKARDKGFAETMLGRRLELAGLRSSNQRIRSEAERVAINMPIQGSAADIIKIAMIDIHRTLPEYPMIIQVHDELVFEVERDQVEEATRKIRELMENAMPKQFAGIVPLVVDFSFGENWLEAH